MRRVPLVTPMVFGLVALSCTACGTFQEAQGPWAQADELSVQAQSAFHQGKARQGIDLLKMSLTVNRGTDRLEAVAQNLNDLGVLAMGIGDSQGARDYLDESLALYQTLGDKAGQLSVRLNLLGLAMQSADSDASQGAWENECKQMIDEAGSLHLPIVQASAQSQLAQILLRTKRYPEACNFFEQALSSYRKAKSPWGEGMSLHNLADVEYRMGQHEKAKGHVQQAMDADRQGQYWPALADDLFLRADIHNALGDSAGALHFYQRAYHVYHYVGDASKMDRAMQAMKKLGWQETPGTDVRAIPR